MNFFFFQIFIYADFDIFLKEPTNMKYHCVYLACEIGF